MVRPHSEQPLPGILMPHGGELGIVVSSSFPRTVMRAGLLHVLACRSALCTRSHIQARGGIPGQAGLCLHPAQLQVCSEALHF